MDDFSFPTIQTDQDSACSNLPFPHFAASPLWFLSSVSNEKTAYRRSFSSAEEAVKVADALNVSALSDEEKMDMLWEDFNEDFYRVSCDWKKKDSKGKSGSVSREFRCLLPHRRPSLVVMLKVLKKLFLIQKNGSAKRASICKI